jgi:Na+/melibiose symporter-like transporter
MLQQLLHLTFVQKLGLGVAVVLVGYFIYTAIGYVKKP